MARGIQFRTQYLECVCVGGRPEGVRSAEDFFVMQTLDPD